MKPAPDDKLLALLRRMDQAEAQNRLMRIADRELAVAMSYMSEHDRSFVLSLIARTKARRIREEFGFQKHLAVRYDQYRTTIEHVIRQLAGDTRAPFRSYLRPKNRRPE